MNTKIYPELDYDLKKTLIHSGQSFCWFEKNGWIITGVSKFDCNFDRDVIIKLRQENEAVEVETNIENIDYIKSRIGVNKKNRDMINNLSEESFLDFDVDEELRLVEDPLFQTTLSFINSSANNISRIRNSQRAIYEAGREKRFNGNYYNIYPSPSDFYNINLSSKNLGYRESYIKETIKKFRNGFKHRIKRNNKDHDKKELTKLTGVGDKVSDCICLYSLGYTEIIPVDTWIDSYLSEKNFSVGKVQKKLKEKSGMWQLQVYNKYRD